MHRAAVRSAVAGVALFLASLFHSSNAQGCGGQMWSSGRLTSPNYPAPYMPNVRCMWQLRPEAERPVTLRIVNLRLESPWDTLRVYHRLASPAANDVPLAVYTGSVVNLTRSFRTGYVITVVFTSDESMELSGFEAVFYSNASSPRPIFVPPLNLPVPGVCGVPAVARGTKATDESNRIVGGNPTTVNEYPWQVALTRSSTNSTPYCGGAVISNQWIVTLAHCVEPRAPAEHYIILDNEGLSDGTQQRFTASKIIVHPDYTIISGDNDIALVKLIKQAKFTEAVRPVCLPVMDAAPGTKCVASGWGDTLGTGTDAVLRHVSVPILNRTSCKNLLQESFTKNMNCAGYLEGGKETCQGDSGGPLVCKKDGIYYLYGITSRGVGCADPLRPVFYTRVAGYFSWITQTIAEN